MPSSCTTDPGLLRPVADPAGGATLAQLLIGISILGILAALSITSWRKYTHRQALLGEARALITFLQEARAYGQKRDLPVGVTCIASGNSCTLFEDLDQNGVGNAGEVRRTYQVGGRISFGLPADPPAYGPDGSAPPASGLTSGWSDALIFPRDAMAGLVPGGLYLRQAQLADFSICIRSQGGGHRFDLSAWDGVSWKHL